MALTTISLNDESESKKDYEKRVEFLKEIGIEPVPYNGNTISGHYFDYNQAFTGYSSRNLPFNILQYNTWKAQNTQDINDGFLRLLNSKFNNAVKQELIVLTELYIKESLNIAEKFERIDFEQTQFWLGHNKWLNELLAELTKVNKPNDFKILPIEISARLISRKREEFNIDIDAAIEQINKLINFEVVKFKNQLQGRLSRFPNRAKTMFDEYEAELENEYNNLKYVFGKRLFDASGNFIKEELFNELKMVFSYPNANLDDFIKKGIHQLATIAKIELLSDFKANKNVQKPKFTLKQVAIIRFYKKEQVFTDNQNEIAKEYGHNSGQKLFAHYQKVKEFVSSYDENEAFTDRQFKSWMTDFEKASNALSGEPRNNIESMINGLQLAKNDREYKF